jgi:hypothetical protein
MKLRTIALLFAGLLLFIALTPSGLNQPAANPGVALADDDDDRDKDDRDDGDDDDDDEQNRGKNPKAEGRHDNGWHRGGSKGRGENVPIVLLDDPATSTPAAIRTPTSTPRPTTSSLTPVADGSILVRVMRCPAGTPTSGRDWQSACTTAMDGAELALEALSGEYAGWSRSGKSSLRGIVRFDALPAGRYRLELIGANWCHAESDSVDIDGNLVVGTGASVTVWTFVCQG